MNFCKAKCLSISILLIFLGGDAIFGQSIEVEYHLKKKKKINLTQENVPNFDAEYLKIINKSLNDKVNVYKLNIDQEGSVFYWDSQFTSTVIENSTGFKQSLEDRIYKDYKGQIFSFRDNECDRGKSVVVDKFSSIGTWELINQDSVIGDYRVKKAILNGDVTAWYCPDIPFRDGPYLACQLPGLILLLESKKFAISMKSMNNANKTSEKHQYELKEVKSYDTYLNEVKSCNTKRIRL